MDRSQVTDANSELQTLRDQLAAEVALRQAAEARAEHLNRVLRSITSVNQLIMREKDRWRLVQGICDLLVTTQRTPGVCAYAGARIVLLSAEGGPELMAEAGLVEGASAPAAGAPSAVREIASVDSPGQPANCGEEALAAPGVVVIEKPTTASAAACADCPQAAADRDWSALSVRLASGDAVYGWLTVTVAPDRAHDPEEQALIQEVADDVAFALQDMVLAEEREHAAVALEESEARLNKILQTANDGMWDWDLTTDEVVFDARYYRMAGYEVDAFPHRLEEFQSRVHPDDIDDVMRTAEQYLLGEIDRFNVEFRFRKQDGAWLWVMGRGVVLERGADGAPLRFVGTHTDITERKRVEAALRDSEERYRELVENQSEGIGTVDANEVFTFANPAADAIMGVPTGELVGRSLLDFVDSAGAEMLRQQTAFRRDGAPGTYELSITRADGEARTLLVSSQPQADPDGEYRQTFGVFRDITERRRIERALRDSHDRMITILESIDADVYVVDMDTYEILFMNAHMRESFGEDLVGKICWEVFRGEDGPCEHCTNHDLVDDSGNPVGAIVWEGQNPITGKWYINHDRAIRWVDGSLVKLQVATDITAVKEATAALQESEARNRAILDALPDLVFVLNDEGVFVDYHTTDDDALLAEPSSFLGQPLGNLLPAEHATALIALIQRGLESGETQVYEYDLLIREQRRSFEARIVPYRENRVLSIVRELTERRQAEQEAASLARFPSENPNPVLRIDRAGILVYANGAAFRLLSPWELQIAAPAPQALLRLVEAHTDRRAGTANSQSSRDLRCGDRVFAVAVAPGVESDDINVYARDITERMLAEQALRESERQKELILNSTAEMVIYYDADLRVVWANRATSEAVGRPLLELVDAGCREIWRQDGAADVVCSVEKAQASVSPAEAMQQTPDGRYWAVRSYPILGTDDGDRVGCLTALVEFGQDITEQRRSQAERELLLSQIREQARQFQQILATVPAGVLLLRGDGTVLQANPVAEQDLKLLANAGVGDRIDGLGDLTLADLLATPSTLGLWHVIYGAGRTFEAIARPVEPALTAVADGRAPEDYRDGDALWVLVLNDVTREREVRAQLQQQERLAAVGQLAAGIAHDFNNILATIILYAQMVARSPDLGDRNRERMSVIDQQGWHATRLIDQILDFSRRSVLERRPLDLVPLLKEQVKLLERTLPESIRIDLDYGRGELMIDADPTRIQQMLTNLAVNARDAMPDGGVLKMSVGRERVRRGQSPVQPEMSPGEWIRLTVSDTGIGIRPEILPHIFEPFFTTKAPGSGSGLGLAQVHGIVGQHGGRIGVSSQPGGGATFTVYLPALSAAPLDLPDTELAGLPLGSGETLLVVEDDEALRVALVEILAQLNYRVLAAHNGREAQDLLAKSPEVALVLSDLVMPEMGGVSLLRTIRELDLQLPVVIMSGHPMQAELEAMQALSLTGWLLKPPSIERLAELIADTLDAANSHVRCGQ